MAPDPTPISVILLVDRAGSVLLMERDEHAPVCPDMWGLVGGHVEPGEGFDEAAQRELEEETGLDLGGALELWLDDEFSYPDGTRFRYHAYTAGVDLTDADIVVGEGRQIVFVPPERFGELDLTPSAGHFLPRFLASAAYAGLTASRPGA